ncbi:MAG: amidohydrolase family protein [Betaproteobacteria bacterium]
MRTVDVHAHILFPDVMGLAGAAGPEMGVADGQNFFRSGHYVLRGVRFTGSPFSDVSLRLAAMDRLGIDHQLLSPNPLSYFYAQPAAAALAFCRAQNDAMARTVRKHPQRFSGLAQLPMQDVGAAVSELRRAVGELGLRGAYIGSDFAGTDLAARTLDPVWCALEALDVPVVVHPAPADVERGAGDQHGSRKWDLDLVIGFAHDETASVAHLLFGGVLDRHPRLRVHIPHAGGTAPFLKGRLQTALRRRPWAQALLQRGFADQWAQLTFDCLAGTDEAMAFVIGSEGAGRVMLGTNFAGWDQEDDIVARVAALPIAAQAREQVLGRTAIEYFRLGP